jgi:KUP system potassium uptake protein
MKEEKEPVHSDTSRVSTKLLALAALGVVFGDIGTSPLYVLRVCFSGAHIFDRSPENVLGILSLIIWSLIALVTVKYLFFILHADNKGEGGILALTALAAFNPSPNRRLQKIILVVGLFGAALLYGDGMITPAISVLSAVEGLHWATPLFEPVIIPITIAILILLFLFQRYGTSKVGSVFGPVMVIWFVALAILGLRGILHNPQVFYAFNPWYALNFLRIQSFAAFLVLGGVFLALTGAEALYADIGHFGKYPIRLTWFAFVFPALLLNYLGQGAMILQSAEALENPFYYLAPQWAIYPLIILATAATIIASQAIITGAFSLTRQAMQLGYSPRMEVRHSSAEMMGQIYIPQINRILMIASISLVFFFRSSDNLAGAYGVAVSTTMLITTLLAFTSLRKFWKWNFAGLIAVFSVFLIIEIAFFTSNIFKIWHGGWFPILVAMAVYLIMTTWHRGRNLLAYRFEQEALSIDDLLRDIETRPPHRVPGTAIYMTTNPVGVPRSLLHNLRHNKILHQKIIFCTVHTDETPRVQPGERMQFENLGQGVLRLNIYYGFMETPNIPYLLTNYKDRDFEYRPMQTTFFFGRETLLITRRGGMARWLKSLFALLSRNSYQANLYYQIPANNVVELGQFIEL